MIENKVILFLNKDGRVLIDSSIRDIIMHIFHGNKEYNHTYMCGQYINNSMLLYDFIKNYGIDNCEIVYVYDEPCSWKLISQAVKEKFLSLLGDYPTLLSGKILYKLLV